METQAAVALIVGIVVVLFVPALVWSTVIAGLHQTGRAKMRECAKTVARQVPVSAE